jgi:hypothetical protein
MKAPPHMLHIDRARDLLVAVCYAPTHARLGDKNRQADAHSLVFYRLGVHGSSPENCVHDEASNLDFELDLGGLDLAQKLAPEGLDRQRPSGLRVADELADVLLRDPSTGQKLDQVAVIWVGTNFFRPERPATPDISITPICKKSSKEVFFRLPQLPIYHRAHLYRSSRANIKGLCYENCILSVGMC